MKKPKEEPLGAIFGYWKKQITDKKNNEKDNPFFGPLWIKSTMWFLKFIYCGLGEVGGLFNPQISVTFGI